MIALRLWKNKAFIVGICKSFTINYLHIKRQKSDCVDSMKSQKWEDLTFLTLLNRAGNKKCQL
jgi:hypothetical protein